MNIVEATKKALKCNGYITGGAFKGKAFIKPTNTPSCCIAYGKGCPPLRGWEPIAEDLICNNWDVVKELNERD